MEPGALLLYAKLLNVLHCLMLKMPKPKFWLDEVSIMAQWSDMNVMKVTSELDCLYCFANPMVHGQVLHPLAQGNNVSTFPKLKMDLLLTLMSNTSTGTKLGWNVIEDTLGLDQISSRVDLTKILLMCLNAKTRMNVMPSSVTFNPQNVKTYLVHTIASAGKDFHQTWNADQLWT